MEIPQDPLNQALGNGFSGNELEDRDMFSLRWCNLTTTAPRFGRGSAEGGISGSTSDPKPHHKLLIEATATNGVRKITTYR